MKSTRVVHLVGFAFPAATFAFLLAMYRSSHGQTVPVSGWASLLVIVVIIVVLLALAFPIYRYRRALLELAKNQAAGKSTVGVKRPKRIDPFYAVRVLLLAKATGLALTLYFGWHLGLVLFQVSLPVVAEGVWLNAAGALVNLVGVVAAIVVERLCKIPGGTDEPPLDTGEASAA